MQASSASSATCSSAFIVPLPVLLVWVEAKGKFKTASRLHGGLDSNSFELCCTAPGRSERCAHITLHMLREAFGENSAKTLRRDVFGDSSLCQMNAEKYSRIRIVCLGTTRWHHIM